MIAEKCYQRNLDFETALLIIFVTFVLSKCEQEERMCLNNAFKMSLFKN